MQDLADRSPRTQAAGKVQAMADQADRTSGSSTATGAGGGSTRSRWVPSEQGPIGGDLNKLRDAGDSISTGAGNVVAGTAAAVTGVDIDTTDTHAPTWDDHGAFRWQVTFSTTATGNGWVVQQIQNTYRGTDSAGAAITNARTGTTPKYYEAWPVQNGNVMEPWGPPSNDTWGRVDQSAWLGDDATQGRWSMRGKVYFTRTDPTLHGLAPGNVANAGDLPSAIAAPPDLGLARLHRYANGTWDSTGLLNRHSGNNR